MPRSVEIAHFSNLLASLVIAAARATTVEQLTEVHEVLEETFHDVFSLLSYDADRDLVADLTAALSREKEAIL